MKPNQHTKTKMKTLFLTSLAALCLCASVAKVEAQVSSIDLVTVTSVPPVVALSVVTNGWTQQPILITRNCALAIAGQFYQTNVIAGSAVTIGGSFSIDQTNFGLAPFTLTGTAPSNSPAWVQAGTNIVNNNPIMMGTNWTQFQLSGYAAVEINVFTNGSAATSVFGTLKLNKPTLNTQTY
jgi:hypothetical protein